MLSISVPSPAFGGEVMTVTETAELSRLIAPVNSEGAALAARNRWVNRLHRVQAARAALASVDESSRRAALQARRDAAGELGRQ